MARKFNLGDKVRVLNRYYARKEGLVGKIGEVIQIKTNTGPLRPLYRVEFPSMADKVDIVINFYPRELENEDEKER